MMIWAQIKLLFPTFVSSWVITVGLATAAWYVWTKFFSKIHFKWQVPVIFASLFCVYSYAQKIVNLNENEAVFAFNSANQQGGQQADANKIKQTFLNNVDFLVSNPKEITPENKAKVFAGFSAKDKDVLKDVVGSFYTCQSAVWKDALDSFKTKKAVKSDLRNRCEQASGAFFNREKLWSPETMKGNDKLVATAAAHKRMPASDGKEIDLNDKVLNQQVENQQKALQTLQKIFE